MLNKTVILSFCVVGALALIYAAAFGSGEELSLSDRINRVEVAKADFLKANKVGKANSELVKDLLEAGSDLVMASDPKDQSQVREHLSLIPQLVGCRRLDPSYDDKLLRINIYLGQDHRPMCQHVQCGQASSTFVEPGGTPVINETTTYCP